MDDGQDPYPEAQHLAAVELVAYLVVKYDIPLDNIVAHYDVSPGRKTDPKSYDMDRLRREVALIVGGDTLPTSTPTPPATTTSTRPANDTPIIQASPSSTPNSNIIPVADGFDFPLGPRGPGVNVFDYYKIDATLVDPAYFKSFDVWHPGEDWNGLGGGDTDLGDPVYAVAHGRVSDFGSYPLWGNIVLMEHVLPDGTTLWSQYAYLDQIMVTETGQIVERGQQIGTIGKGAEDRNPAFLHFEIRRTNMPINNWSPMVQDRDAVLRNYHSPIDFISNHRPSSAEPSPTPTQPPTSTPLPTPDLTATAEARPSFPPPGRIIFASNRASRRDLYSMKADGTDIIRLTRDIAFDFDPQGIRSRGSTTYSPRELLTFTASDNDLPALAIISSAKLEQTTASFIPNGIPGWHPSFSPDGQSVVFVSENRLIAGCSDGWELYA